MRRSRDKTTHKQVYNNSSLRKIWCSKSSKKILLGTNRKKYILRIFIVYWNLIAGKLIEWLVYNLVKMYSWITAIQLEYYNTWILIFSNEVSDWFVTL